MNPVPDLFVSSLLNCLGNINSIPTLRELAILVCSLPSHSASSLALSISLCSRCTGTPQFQHAPRCLSLQSLPQAVCFAQNAFCPPFPCSLVFILLVSACLSSDSSGLGTSHLSWIEGICWFALHFHFPSSLEGSSWIPQFRNCTPP